MRTRLFVEIVKYQGCPRALLAYMTLESVAVGTSARREIARARTVEVMRRIQENIAKDDRVNVSQAAEEAGMAPSTFYRWLKKPPQKVDVIQVATLADYLHDAYGHESFAKLWRDVESAIK